MESETPEATEIPEEIYPSDFQEEMIPCPNCKEMVPLSLYCLKCGFPLHMLRQQDDRIDDTIETDEGSLARVQGLTKDLMNSISLKLWSIDLLREGTIDEEHFNRLFEGYQARSVQCMGRRKLMLARCARDSAAKARDLEPIERALKEARVNLGELEMRQSIRDLHEGEYEAKAPAFRWQIRYYEEEISRRKGEMTFLENLTRVIPEEEIANMKGFVGKAHGMMGDLLGAGKIGPETATRVKTSLEETKAFLENFR
jgi:hypothetical protein